MKKRGFTLIEMMVVVAFLAIILLIAVPNITGMLKKVDNEKYQRFQNDVFLATEAYLQKNIESYPNLALNNKKVYVYFSELISSKYLKSNTYDTKNKELVKNEDFTVEVYLNDDNEYTYTILEERKNLDIVINDLKITGRVISFTIVAPRGLKDYQINTSSTESSEWTTKDGETEYSVEYYVIANALYYIRARDYKNVMVTATILKPAATVTFSPSSAYLTKTGSAHDTQVLNPTIKSAATDFGDYSNLTINFNLYEGDTQHVGSSFKNTPSAYFRLFSKTGVLLKTSDTVSGLGAKSISITLKDIDVNQLEDAYISLTGSASCYRRGIGVAFTSYTLVK